MNTSRPKRKRVTPVKGRRSRVRGTRCPCPECGSPTRVIRTTLGERSRTITRLSRIYVVRERRCIGRARHRFHTEEHPR